VFAPRPRFAFGGIMNGAAGSESSIRLAREPDHHVGPKEGASNVRPCTVAS